MPEFTLSDAPPGPEMKVPELKNTGMRRRAWRRRPMASEIDHFTPPPRLKAKSQVSWGWMVTAPSTCTSDGLNQASPSPPEMKGSSFPWEKVVSPPTWRYWVVTPKGGLLA